MVYPILYGSKLFQQHCVEEYAKIESIIIECDGLVLADAYMNVDT